MADDKKVPSHQDIAFARRIDQMIPGYSDKVEADRLDALEKIEAERRDRQERYDRAMRRVTYTSVFVAVCAAAAALWSGYEAHETRVQDERPYLVFSVSTQALKTGPLQITGLGKSPALNIRLYCEFKDRSKVSWYELEKSKAALTTYAVVMPGQILSPSCFAPDKPVKGTAVYGVMQYRDAGNHQYQTPFCFDYFGDTPSESIYIEPCDSKMMSGAPPFR